MATHTSILARKIPRTEEPGRLQSTSCEESDTTEHANLHLKYKRYWLESAIKRTSASEKSHLKRTQQQIHTPKPRKLSLK